VKPTTSRDDRSGGVREHRALAYARVAPSASNELGRYTDDALVMWYEMDTTRTRGRIPYSVIFSNEGRRQPPADRLLATWGRLTEIE